MALIHYNMATYIGGASCSASNWATSSQPGTFMPTALDTDNWVQSMLDLGAKEAVLTAKHNCGFLLWPTKVLGWSREARLV